MVEKTNCANKAALVARAKPKQIYKFTCAITIKPSLQMGNSLAGGCWLVGECAEEKSIAILFYLFILFGIW